MTYGLYEVIEGHTFRGLMPGEQFEAPLDRGREVRAVVRGVIRVVDTLEPALQPDSYTFPEGWLASPYHQTTEAREGLSY